MCKETRRMPVIKNSFGKKGGILHQVLFLLYITGILSPKSCFGVDWGEDKIKATAAISSLLAPWQIGPLSSGGLIYQAKDGYWNCPTSHKSDQWIGLYPRQGRHHSVVAGRGGTGPFKSLSCISELMDVACLTSLWPGAAGCKPSLCLTSIIIWQHVLLWFVVCRKTLTLSGLFPEEVCLRSSQKRLVCRRAASALTSYKCYSINVSIGDTLLSQLSNIALD